MSAHTPGPWRAAETCDAFNLKIRGFSILAPAPAARPGGSTSKQVAECDETVRTPWEEVQANAALISAAPELLAALKEAEMALARDPHDPMLVNIRYAIAKAEGRKT